MLNPWARIESIDSVMFVEFKIGCPFISLMAKYSVFRILTRTDKGVKDEGYN